MANWSNGFFWLEPAPARSRPLGLAVAAALAAGWLIAAEALPASAQTACGAAPPLDGSIQNGVVEGDVIVLGSLSDRPYVVAIPGEAEADLEALRLCVGDAFVTTARLGPFLQAGTFTSHADARAVAQWLRSQGFDARVIYRP
jgi:hypothetical protein